MLLEGYPMKRASVNVLAFVVLAVLLTAYPLSPPDACGATKSWADGSDNWSVPGDWSPTGVPGATDVVSIVGVGAGSNVVVNYDYTGSAVTLGGLTIDRTAGGPASDQLTMSANNLSSTTEIIGNSGRAIFVQSGGSNTNSAGLSLGNNSGSNGSYNLSNSGSLSTTGGTGLVVGFSGTGTFNQSGGSNSLSGNSLNIGNTASGLGTYNLSGGAMTVMSTSATAPPERR
jgi:hypothetical protein